MNPILLVLTASLFALLGLQPGCTSAVSPPPAHRLACLRPSLESERPPSPLLVEGARYAVLAGRLEEDRDHRIALYLEGEAYARQALGGREDGFSTATDSAALEWLIAGMGLRVDDEGSRGKVGLAQKIHGLAEATLLSFPNHPGAHHALGRVHAGIMRLGRFSRFLARQLVGGEALRSASWHGAELHLVQAMELEPKALHHALELAIVLLDQGRLEEGQEMLREVFLRPGREEDALDDVHRQRARTLLACHEEGGSLEGQVSGCQRTSP